MAYFPKETPDVTSSGRMRLYCTETVNESSNSSTVTINVQLNPTSIESAFNLQGSLTVNGTAVSIDTTSGVCKANTWTTIWTKSFTIAHNDDGTKTLPIVVKNPSNWPNGLTAWVFYSYGAAGATGYFFAWVPNGTYNMTLTNIDVGSTVRIDNGSSFQEYYIYIDNGSSFSRYDAYYDNGSSWTKL